MHMGIIAIIRTVFGPFCEKFHKNVIIAERAGVGLPPARFDMQSKS